MWAVRGNQLFIIFVIGLSMVLATHDGNNKGPFGTLPEYQEGTCVSPEPEGVLMDKIDDQLTNHLETEGFSVAMCSKSYAALIFFMYDGSTRRMPNGTAKFSGKYEANREDLEVYLSCPEKPEPIKMRCETVAPAKKKCYKLSSNEFTTILTTVWQNDKLKLVVGCTSDGHKFWAVFSARVANKNDDVHVDDKDKKIICDEVKKLGFKKDMRYY